jgi:dienelactone hydrolase
VRLCEVFAFRTARHLRFLDSASFASRTPLRDGGLHRSPEIGLAGSFAFDLSGTGTLACAFYRPVYGFYAGNDARIDATIPDTVAAMKAAGKSYDPVTYGAAGHGFMRAGEAPGGKPGFWSPMDSSGVPRSDRRQQKSPRK